MGLINKFLQPFVDDLKTLYLDGIPISVNNEVHTFYGALLAFLGDNLAAHYIGGFKQNFSTSLRICRSRMVTPAQCQKFLMRLTVSCVHRRAVKSNVY